MTDVLLVDFARNDQERFAAALGQESYEELLDILIQLPAELAVPVAARLPYRQLIQLVGNEADRVTSWLGSARVDDAALLIGRLPRERGIGLVNDMVDNERRRRLLQFLHFPAHCVGSVVTTAMVQVVEDAPVAEALAELRDADSAADRSGEIPVVVLDGSGRYSGKLDLWRLLLDRNLTGQVRNYVLPAPTLRAEINLGGVRELAEWHEHLWLAVVDHEDRVLGVVSRSRIEESAADYDSRGDLLIDNVADAGSQLIRVSGGLLTRLLVERGSA